MSDTAWYRSLYWRIGIGFVVFLIAVLALQAGAMFWLISRMDVAPGPPPPELTRLVARDLGEALAENPKLDIQQFLRQAFDGRVQLVAIFKDGRVVASHDAMPPTQFVVDMRAWLALDPAERAERGGRGFGPRPMRPNRPMPGPDARFPAPPPRRFGPAGVVFVNGEEQGVVMAIPRSAFRQLGPTMTVVGVVLVAVATTVAAMLIFSPVRRRLHSLEEAAKKVGAGDLSARAREDGGDEVAALARSFNQMTQDLHARAEQLQAADRTRRLLLADVSHELMTPLTGMRGYLETLSLHAQSLDPETRERYLSIVRDETLRVEHIVGDLLDLARLESGGGTFDAQDVPVEDLFGRVLARHGHEAEQKGVLLAADVEPGAEIVTGDPMRLEQAFQNLAANALRHTPRGGRVALKATLHDGRVVVTVSDTGSGIAPEHLPHVFDRFYKVDPSRVAQSSGSGLGLSIVKAIFERHGARVSVTSSSAQGTTFTIVFPAMT
jgi:signal transduction histidine kinase